MRSLLPLLLVSLLGACVSTHPGKFGEPENSESESDLLVSAEVVDLYSDKAHRFLSFTFESKGTEWIRIESVDFEYSDKPDVRYNVIVGKDLLTWADAFRRRKARKDHNRGVILGLIIGAGALLAASSDDESVEAAGTTVAVAGASAGLLQALAEDLQKKEAADAVPDTHLHSPFTVPAGMFVRKWILVNVPDRDPPSAIKIKVNRTDGTEDVLRFDLAPEKNKVVM